MGFFRFFAGVLSDPPHQQGSTKRLCLFLFLTTVMVLLAYATLTGKSGQLPEVPGSILALVKFTVGSLLLGIGADKGIAAYKVVNAAPSTPSTEPTPSTEGA